MVSAITWSGGYVIAGRVPGPYWEQAAAKIGQAETLVLPAVVLIAATFVARAMIRKRRRAA